MDLKFINKLAVDAYFINTKYNKSVELEKGREYKILSLNRRKTMFGSVIEVTIDADIEINIPSFRSQKLFEQDHSLYRLLKNFVDYGSLCIKYLGNKEIIFIDVNSDK